MAYEFCASSAADGVRYAEVTFTAAAHAARLGLGDEPLLGVLAGFRAGASFGVEVRVSNVALGLVPAFAAHPLPRLRHAGVPVTLNTVIPSVAGRTLSDEYAGVRSAFGWSDPELAALALAGVAASFAPASVKDRLRAEIASWLDSPGI